MPIQFSFEVPLNNLYDFEEDQDFIFALSFLFKEKAYTDYIEQCKKPLWIDNSYNETKQACSPSLMVNLYKTYKPRYIISPDHADWGPQGMLDTYMELVENGISQYRLMIIIHSPDWIGHYRSYGVYNFCIPYDFRYTHQAKLKAYKDCHFLGLVHPGELQLVKPPSCDTSMPIKLAMEDKTMDQWVAEGCPHIHTKKDFFYLRMTPKQITLAKANINWLKGATYER